MVSGTACAGINGMIFGVCMRFVPLLLSFGLTVKDTTRALFRSSIHTETVSLQVSSLDLLLQLQHNRQERFFSFVLLKRILAHYWEDLDGQKMPSSLCSPARFARGHLYVPAIAPSGTTERRFTLKKGTVLRGLRKSTPPQSQALHLGRGTSGNTVARSITSGSLTG